MRSGTTTAIAVPHAVRRATARRCREPPHTRSGSKPVGSSAKPALVRGLRDFWGVAAEEPNPPTPFPEKEGGERARRLFEGRRTQRNCEGLAPPSFSGKGV